MKQVDTKEVEQEAISKLCEDDAREGLVILLIVNKKKSYIIPRRAGDVFSQSAVNRNKGERRCLLLSTGTYIIAARIWGRSMFPSFCVLMKARAHVLGARFSYSR